MIEKSTIDEIFDRADIVDVISDFVQLRRAGTSFKGLCPFHNERTPSFSVSPSRNTYHCFGCGAHGTAVNFLMEHEAMTYPEALRWLANKYGITVKETQVSDEDMKAKGERESLLAVNNWAVKYFKDNLANSDEGKSMGMGYFRNRELRDDIIEKFSLGYCPQDAKAMGKAAKREGYKEEYLVTSGLCARRDDGSIYDKYHGRVIYPILSISGQVVAFGGRVLGKAVNTGKYINSNESVLYHKNRELYGLFYARKAIQKAEFSFLVEGYMDVIAMHQNGVENVVASCGTALTEGQIQLLRRFTQKVTVLYDGDAAGIHASLKSINMFLEAGFNMRVLFLPDNDDPDSFSRKHPGKEFQDYLASHQEDFMSFVLRFYKVETLEDPVRKAEVTHHIVSSIALIPDILVRDAYISLCSKRMGVDVSVLKKAVSNKRSDNYNQRKREEEQKRQREERQQMIDLGMDASAIPEDTGDEQLIKIPLNRPQPASSLPKTENKAKTKRDRIEENLIRYVVVFGDKSPFQEETNSVNAKLSVVGFMNLEFMASNLGFKNPLYNKLYSLALQHCEEPDWDSQNFFLSYPDPEINAVAAQLIDEKYQLSESFAEKQVITSTEDKLDKLVPQAINSLKVFIVTTQLDDVIKELRNPEVLQDNKKLEALMRQSQQLKEIQKTLEKKNSENDQ